MKIISNIGKAKRTFGMAAAVLAAVLLLSVGTACAAGGGEEPFAPDGFLFSGGSGRMTITCPEVEIRDGQPWATLVFSSSHYPFVKVGGVQYDTEHPENNSVVSVPVTLNEPVEVLGTTTAMSEPHEITYRICVLKDAPEELIPGLVFREKEETDAELLEILRYEGGYTLVRVSGAGRFLLVPAEEEIPAPLEADIQPVRIPAENVYAEQESVLALLPAADAVTLTGFEMDGTVFAGAGAELKLPLLLKNKCALAILGPEWAEEGSAQLRQIREALGEYDIPAFVDLSGEETTEEGAAAWRALYAEMLGQPTAEQAG